MLPAQSTAQRQFTTNKNYFLHLHDGHIWFIAVVDATAMSRVLIVWTRQSALVSLT